MDANLHGAAYRSLGALLDLKAVIRTGILSHVGHPLFLAAVTYMLINLKDVMIVCEKGGHRIVDRVGVSGGDKISDLTDLIAKCRNAACHLTTPLHLIDDVVRTGIVIGHREETTIEFGALVLRVKADLIYAYERSWETLALVSGWTPEILEVHRR